jgi:hypothetical protein
MAFPFTLLLSHFLLRKTLCGKGAPKKGPPHSLSNRMATDVQKFFGGSLPGPLIRPRLTSMDVPQDDSGIRQLATTGAWLAAQQLAERLEAKALDPATKAPTDLSLRYTLVRVTAFLKMNQPDAAKRALDALGPDILRAAVAAAGESAKKAPTAPFSLVFLHALVPGFLGQPAVSQGRLYDLLAVCEGWQSHGVLDRLLWKSRSKRVRRALVGSHLEANELEVAISILSDLAECETDEVAHLWNLQQLGCLCLRSGNVFLALEVFKTIENTAVDDEPGTPQGYDVGEFKKLIASVNKGLLMAFRGEYAEAQQLFRSVASDGYQPTATSPGDPPPLVALLKSCCVASAEGTCAAYLAAPKGSDEATARSIQQVVSQLEVVIAKSPKALVGMDAALVTLSRLYQLEGEHGAAKTATLANLVEMFRCGREALPKFLK